MSNFSRSLSAKSSYQSNHNQKNLSSSSTQICSTITFMNSRDQYLAQSLSYVAYGQILIRDRYYIKNWLIILYSEI